MSRFTMVGADIKLYINNKVYNVAQAVSWEVDYGEAAIRGIDSPWAQEIAGGIASIRGNVRGLRIKQSGGLQGVNARPAFFDLAASPYISIRIQDRSTGEDLVLIQRAKVSKESHTAATKGTYKLNFDFEGQMPLFALDRA